MSVDGVFDRWFVEVEEGAVGIVAHWWVTITFPTGNVWDKGVSGVVNVFDPRGYGIGVA